jgi:hypothetical protein
MSRAATNEEAPDAIAIQVAERGVLTTRGYLRCEIGSDLQFSTDSLESYFFARWEPAAYDALLVAAAVEFADITHKRPAHAWARSFNLRVPVHDPARWSSPSVSAALQETLAFLTGDHWTVTFYARKDQEPSPRQGLLALGTCVEAVIPYSNGLDSRAVAGMLSRTMGTSLVRIRLGATLRDGEALVRTREAFTSVPYHVRPQQNARRESSGRSRGFKFAVISGIAAFLANAPRIVIPESGQGAVGPALVTVGQAYEDYRSHPLFTRRMETFLAALFGHRVEFTFPRIWATKGETLSEYVEASRDQAWSSTRSCWQQNRQVSVDGKARQCGICAACMLRRMSVHAAGLAEPAEQFVWQDLSVARFEDGAAPSFSAAKITTSMREYAIAGVLHMDHLAALLESRANVPALNVASFQLGTALGIPVKDSRARLERLLRQHRDEWHSFVRSLGKHSFVSGWAGSVEQ